MCRVGSLTLCDDGKTEVSDLGSQFFLTAEDVGQPRAAACVRKLAELNKYCKCSVVEGAALDATIASVQVPAMPRVFLHLALLRKACGLWV